jgi:membrane dipeptidase
MVQQQQDAESEKLRRWFIVDGHLDLAYNALGWGRNYRRAARWNRQREAGTRVAQKDGLCSVGLPDLVRGRVGIVFGTIFTAPSQRRVGDGPLTYRDEEEAHEIGMRQLDFYHRWAEQEKHVRLVGTRRDLEEVLASWQTEDERRTARADAKRVAGTDDRGRTTEGSGPQPGDIQALSAGLIAKDDPLAQILLGLSSPVVRHQVGIVPLLEGADAVLEPKELERWVERGLRIVGPAWHRTRYAAGSDEPGGLTAFGRELLEIIASLGVILDVSHLAEQALFEALEHFEGGPGRLIASHSNPRHIVPGERHLPDQAIEQIAERRGVIGVVLFNAFLKRGWGAGSRKSDVSLDDVVRAVDHICQVTGSADYVGIGSDFDGGFGAEATPRELDTSRDLHKIGDELLRRGFGADNVEKVMGGNWLRILRGALPA